MCKVDADFTATATAGTIQTPNGDMPLTCGGQYGFTIQALFVWQQATGKPLMTWTDASCADMTKNLTAYFVRDPYMHHLYLKGTMKEFIQTYGAACCGSLEKARDPCETTTPPITPAPTPGAGAGGGGGGGIQHLKNASLSSCMLHATWQDMIESAEWETRFATGGLGKLMVPDLYEVWLCDSKHECAAPGDMMCFTFNEQGEYFEPLALNSQLQLVKGQPDTGSPGSCT